MKILGLLILTCLSLGATSLKREYEAPYAGKPLGDVAVTVLHLICDGDMADSTGFYYSDRAPLTWDLLSSFEKQSKPVQWVIQIDGKRAQVAHTQGRISSFAVTKRDPEGIVLVQSSENPEVITIDPRSSSFVYTTQYAGPLYNRANVLVGQCGKR